MRQGKANPDGRSGWKREPIPRVMNVRAISQIGQALGNKATDKSSLISEVSEVAYAGRGYKAPMRSIRTRQGGSQGSY